MRTSFHHQPEARHPIFSSWQAGLPHLSGVKRTSPALLRVLGIDIEFYRVSLLGMESYRVSLLGMESYRVL